MLDKQLDIEEKAFNLAVSKANDNYYIKTEKGNGSATNEAIILIKRSLPPVAEKLNEYLTSKNLRGKAYAVREPIMDYLGNEDTLAYIVLSCVFDRTMGSLGKYPPYSAPLTSVARSILSFLKRQYKLDSLQNKAPKLDKYVDRKYKKFSMARRTQKKLNLAKARLELDEPDNTMGINLGVNLIDALIKSNAGIATTHTIMNRSTKKKRTYVTLTDTVIELIEHMRDMSPLFHLSYPILVIPPKNWEDFEGSGGYYGDYITEIDLVKMHVNKTNRKMVKNYFKTHSNLMSRYLRIINNIQRTPWKINTKVLDVFNEVYDKHLLDYKEDYKLLGGIPDDDLPDIEEVIPKVEYDTDNPEPFFEYANKIQRLEEKFMTIKSKSLVVKMGVHTANKYKDYDKIYFSYQVDFRGRLYPIQPHLNPQSTKAIKPLLMFAEGKPLATPEAVKWFLIHGANLYGYDKELYTRRVELMENMKSDIIDIAEAPLKNLQWTNADEPYGFLAWCFEASEWFKNPSTFISHLPIALDATCSGIQVYSGLMKDEKGALAVNVVNHDNGNSIADIYGEVATCVNKYLELGDYPKVFNYKTSDGKEHSVDYRPIAQSMIGKINRKITKRNTMTFPYNVSPFGMRDQLIDDILEPYEDSDKQFWVKGIEKWKIAAFLANLNFKGIEETVKGAVAGRDFLKEITRNIVKKGNHIFYKTPIFRFPVIHRIVKYKTSRVTTALAKLSIKVPTTQLDSNRMVNGIAPNYIHSLDATLMFRTVERLIDSGVTSFALIHDSYGIHAADTEKLSKEVRESFIELFETEPLKDFVDQVAPILTNKVDDVIIGDLDLNEVRNSPYIFS